MERDEIIEKIRGRVAKARQLARRIDDAEARTVLNEMADEGESDMVRLLTEQERAGGAD